MDTLQTIAALASADTAKTYIVLGYHAKADGGGGIYWYDSVGNRNTHNGGTVIDPSKTFPTNWSDQAQLTSWFAVGSGVGIWKSLEAAENVVDGRVFGVKFDNQATPVTDNTKALQKALASADTVYLPAGKYKLTDRVFFKNRNKLLCANGRIHIVTALKYALRFDISGDWTDCEFHGTIESTAVSAAPGIVGEGMILLTAAGTPNAHAGSVSKFNFDDYESICPGSIVNGFSADVSSGNIPFLWIKDISLRNNRHTAGQAGIAMINHADDLVVTNITAGAGCTITVSGGARLVSGQTVLFTDIVGSGAVAGLNDQFYIAHNVTASTLQLKDSAGALVNTAGGSYTSGGVGYVYRMEGIDVTGTTIVGSGLTTSYPLGITISGPSLNGKYDYLIGYNNATCLLELVAGGSKSSITHMRTYNATGDLIQLSDNNNHRKAYGNTIAFCKTVGFTTASGMLIMMQRGMVFMGNELDINAAVNFDSSSNCVIQGNIIRSKNFYAPLLFKSSVGANYPCENNAIYDNTLDNSRTGIANRPIAFDGNYVRNNVVDRVTFITASAITNGGVTNQFNGATNNKIVSWRQPNTIDGFVSDAVSSVGNVSTFAAIPGTDLVALSIRDTALTAFVLTLVAFNSNGGQPQADFEIIYAVRNDNTPVGGKIGVHFASYDQKNATPVFYYTGSGTPTISAAALNGSSQYFWVITLPTHNGNVSAKITVAIDPAYKSAFTVTTS